MHNPIKRGYEAVLVLVLTGYVEVRDKFANWIRKVRYPAKDDKAKHLEIPPPASSSSPNNNAFMHRYKQWDDGKSNAQGPGEKAKEIGDILQPKKPLPRPPERTTGPLGSPPRPGNAPPRPRQPPPRPTSPPPPKPNREQ